MEKITKSIRRAWGNLTLGSKLTSLVGVFVVVLVAAMTALIIQREEMSFHQELESQAALLLETLPLTMRDYLYNQELDELAEIASAAGSSPEITIFIIYDIQGRVLVDAAQDNLSFSQVADPLGLSLIGSPPGEYYFDWQEDQLVAGRSISLGNQKIGAVAIGLSTEPLQEKTEALTRQNVWLSVAMLFLGGTVVFLLSQQITNPLVELTEAAVHMMKGNMEVRAEPSDNEDEIGQLGFAFNQMADALQAREAELRKLADGLERLVEERTLELKRTNDTLMSEVKLRRMSQEEMARARNEAIDASRLKTQLLANVSHDLRTPLNVILGYGEMLHAEYFGDLTPKNKEMVGEVIKSAGQLLNFVNNLLDQAQIEAGKLKLNNYLFETRALIDNVFSIGSILAQSKGLALTSEIAPDMPEEVVGDMHWLYQVLFNLINNAIKFTYEGEVRVRIYPADEDFWCMEVSDTGIGIPMDSQNRIFESFWQVDGTPTREHTGTGLGLSIVRQVVDVIGGKLDLKSEEDVGSTFYVFIPFGLEAEEQPS